MSKIAGLLRKLLYVLRIDPRLVAKATTSKTLAIDGTSVQHSMEILKSFSPDPQTSCLTRNVLQPQVDLHIIVPAYNAEKYIRQCLDSVVLPPKSITYCLTVINDGSCDQTASLLKAYEAYPQVEIITQENKGFSGARNAGLRVIKGRYICFLDSDDCLYWPGVEDMFVLAEEKSADMVIGNHYLMDVDGNLKKKVYSSYPNYNGYPWGKLYKAELFENVCFPEQYWFEDSIIKQIIHPQIKNWAVSSQFVYHYRQNPSSITHTARKRPKAIDSLYVTLALHKDRLSMGVSNTEEYYDYILLMSYLTCVRVCNLGQEILENVFIVYAWFVRQTFGSSFSTRNPKLKPIERYLRSCAFGRWEKYCQLIKL